MENNTRDKQITHGKHNNREKAHNIKMISKTKQQRHNIYAKQNNRGNRNPE